MIRNVAAALALLVLAVPLFAARQGGAIPVQLPLFPTNNWWNTDVSNAPVDASSTNFINFINPATPLHPDFGGDAGGGDIYGFPYIIVDGSQPLKTVTFIDFGDESDGVGVPFYPIPDEAITMFGWVEGGQPGNIDQRADGDRHLLIVDKTNDTLYELYNVWFNGTSWEAASGAFFDMKTNNRRPDTWTSADAAGLAILPGLVRYDEVFGPNEINHAFRFTVDTTNDYVYPASHAAGSTAGALPMGARLRLKASVDITGFTPEVQKIFRAFKKYGLIVADNGSDMYISGAFDTRWDNGVLNPAFDSLTAGDFEVVELSWQPPLTLQVTMPRSVPKNGTATATVAATDNNYAVASGYLGTVHFTSTDGAATLPADYTFTAGDGGSHNFTNAFTMRTPGDQTITVRDAGDVKITASRIIAVGPAVPAGLVATAASATTINISWDDAPGATQYEVQRQSSSAGYVTIGTPSTTSFTDTVGSGGVHVYRVRAKDATDASGFSIPDVATTFAFTDDPLMTNSTGIKAIHILEARQFVNLIRSVAGLPDATFTDPVLNSSVRIKAVHLQQVQNALEEARDAVFLVRNSYHDAAYDVDTTTIKAANVRELRNGTK
jgi:hypothetical protein